MVPECLDEINNVVFYLKMAVLTNLVNVLGAGVLLFWIAVVADSLYNTFEKRIKVYKLLRIIAIAIALCAAAVFGMTQYKKGGAKAVVVQYRYAILFVGIAYATLSSHTYIQKIK